MTKWFRDHSYISDEVEILKGLARTYLRSQSEDDLVANRHELLQTLLPEDRKYVIEYWKPREPRLVDSYVRLFANLGHRTTQMSESYHVLIHTVTDYRMSMKTAA